MSLGTDERYRRVLDAAEMCYTRRGWPATSMEAVAATAGVSRAYLYKRFGTKEGLLLAMLERHAEAFNRKASGFISAHPRLADALAEGIMLGVRMAHRDPIFGQLVAAATSYPGQHATVAMSSARRLTDQLWRPVLLAAAARGELADGVAVDDVIEWITMLQLGLLSLKNGLGLPDDVLERQIRTLFVHAIVRTPAIDTASVG